MRLRYCACGAPVVLVGGRRENDRPTGTEHVCEHPFGTLGVPLDGVVARTRANEPGHMTESR